MFRRLLSVLTVLSLALLPVLGFLWIHSYLEGQPDAYDVHRRDHYLRRAEEMRKLSASDSNRAILLAMREHQRRSAERREAPVHWFRCWTSVGAAYFVVSSRGNLSIVQYSASQTAQASGEAVIRVPGLWQIDGEPVRFGRAPPGVGFHEYTKQVPGWQLTYKDFAVPYWALCVLTLVVPAQYAVACLRRWRANNQNRCVNCGYDLRASPQRCPECGTPKPVPHAG